MDRRSFLKFQISLAAFAPMLAGSAFAQSWPSQNITLVVPFTPGGSTDILARLLGQRLGDALGKAVVIENRPGAGGSVASTAVARAAPDGHTLIMGHIGTLGVNPSLYANLQYDPIKSFSHLSMLASVHNILVVHPSLPVKNVQELIAYAKANPGKLNSAASGNGSSPHLASALFESTAGVQFTTIQFKGGGAAATSTIAGDTQVMFATPPTVMSFIKAGRMRALSLTVPQATPSIPGIPGAAEAGLPGYDSNFSLGLFVPAGTPPNVVRALHAATARAMARPGVKERVASQGMDVATNASPEAFAASLRDGAGSLERAVRESGAKVE
jgi:tripartite-type tricarboxylate transporter receptor subunit TctC